ncbi:MAG: Na+/H+ antiporter NhaA, partial [Acidiferrobacterales bacterium]|nr:Na+/H+ antiporter NhaA [Acidiferrobacterales bacterium]
YTEEVLLNNLAIAGGLLGLLVLFNILGVQRPSAYFLVGALVWAAVLESGVHATVAGVLVALTIPARPKVHPWRFLGKVRDLIVRFERKEKESPATPILADQEQHAIAQEIQDTAKLTTTPLQRWEHALERPVALLVLPIFAFANAGIPFLAAEATTVFTDPITLGVLFGLVFGKFIGITAMGWLALKSGAGELPDNVRVGHLAGLGLLAGMGFTMSMFIAGLGFETLPEELLRAKTGILAGSLIAGVTGATWVWLASSKNKASGTGQTT